MTLPLQPNLVGLATAPADCIWDPAKQQLVNKTVAQVSAGSWMQHKSVVPNFLEHYHNWIHSTQLNDISGLESFPSQQFSQGTTESFDKFYIAHHNRTFRCYRGEYLYHQLTWNAANMSWSYLDDAPLSGCDAVVLSWPFADTGNQKHTTDLLDQCAGLGVPVLIDCAFFGICAEHNFDFSHPAITDVCFSLSKSFPVSGLRVGMRYSKNITDGLNVYGRTQYVNKLAAAVATELFEHQSPDDLYLKYRNQQLAWCQQYELEPSQCVTFGLDRNHRYDNHNRGSADSNRICFAQFFNRGALPL